MEEVELEEVSPRESETLSRQCSEGRERCELQANVLVRHTARRGGVEVYVSQGVEGGNSFLRMCNSECLSRE